MISGPKALAFVDHITCNDPKKLAIGQAQYSLLLNPNGGVVDDIIVYRLDADRYLFCVNASNTEKDFSWIVDQNTVGAMVENVSSHYAQIAIQGPRAAQIAAETLGLPSEEFSLESFPSFYVRTKKAANGSLVGKELLFARTGYTGEDGFEIFCAPDVAPTLWNNLMETGQRYGLKPCGLGARDTLRLETGLPLYGHELRDNITVLESGFGWAVKLDKGEFIGRDALLKQKEQGLPLKLVGLEVLDPGIVREGSDIYTADGRKVGFSVSGTKPPTVGKAVANAFVERGCGTIDTELFAEVRGKKLRNKVIKTPFYKRPK